MGEVGGISLGDDERESLRREGKVVWCNVTSKNLRFCDV